MAKRKSKPAKTQSLPTWMVLSNGAELNVEGDLEILDGGALVFHDRSGQVRGAFAAGSWSQITALAHHEDTAET